MLIPKTDTATIEEIKRSIEAAAQDAQGKKWNGYRPPNIYDIIHDGDGAKNNGKPYGDECKGCWVLSASSNNKPQVVDSNIRPIISADEIYSGMYARVTINFYGYAQPQKIGVGCGLGNVMKTRDGERLAGGATAESDFEGFVPPAQGFVPQQGFVPPAQPVYINPLTGLPITGDLPF